MNIYDFTLLKAVPFAEKIELFLLFIAQAPIQLLKAFTPLFPS